MQDSHVAKIAVELSLTSGQVKAVAGLLDEGGTVPFIARYRKEATGTLDEVAITSIRDRLEQLAELDKRREAIVKSLSERQLLTEELEAKIHAAETMAVLEDIYLPFRPKRRTRATIAKEKGLEPLAVLLFAQEESTDPAAAAAGFVDAEKGVETAEDALAGARDIIAEWVNENQEARARMRDLFAAKGVFKSKVIADKEAEGAKFRDYFEWEEPVATAPSHRVLAMRRGENEKVLTLLIAPPEEDALRLLEAQFITGEGPRFGAGPGSRPRQLQAPAVLVHGDGDPSRDEKTRRRGGHTGLYRQPAAAAAGARPWGKRTSWPSTPASARAARWSASTGRESSCTTTRSSPTSPRRERSRPPRRFAFSPSGSHIEAVAVGNGTAGRETEAFVRALGLPNIQVIMVNESGASVYSASQVARDEFPDQDVTVRGSVSIGRRLVDPLAELVKIDPKAIGVGQYQHDVDQGALKRSLDDVVSSCVNAVGVEVNTASAQLLTYVSGLGPQLASNIVAYRNEHGPFAAREGLRKVPRLGPKAFEQAAGFLRIRDGANPLDASAVHPESYPSSRPWPKTSPVPSSSS